MSGHLSSIGFATRTRQEFAQFAAEALQRGDRIRVSGGSYYRWNEGSGAELWPQVDDRGEGIGMNPHFAGTAALRVGLTQRLRRQRESTLDGAYYSWVCPRGDDPNTGLYPLVFDAPDFALHSEVALPAVVVVQVAAFAHTLSAFRTTEEFHAEKRFQNFGSQFFIPSGTFTLNGGAIDPPKAEAFFSGHVIDTERRANQFTGSSYVWAKVETYGGTFDVVADPEIVEGSLAQGGVLVGTFWLSGRLIAAGGQATALDGEAEGGLAAPHPGLRPPLSTNSARRGAWDDGHS